MSQRISVAVDAAMRQETYLFIRAILGCSGKFSCSEVMFLAGCYGVRLASLENCIASVGMSLVRRGLSGGIQRMRSRKKTYQSQGSGLHGCGGLKRAIEFPERTTTSHPPKASECELNMIGEERLGH